ncbi:hypothetical protein [Brachyspira suanatina]|uniref:hypothetical protein n=1 Tax=Brachyspira suanatina TaxID=381802 RepID=UPI001FD7D8E8|nr:hypothetical protein [Brachyspira suanatina]
MKSGDCRTENKESIYKRMLKNGFDVIDKKQIKGFIYSVAGKNNRYIKLKLIISIIYYQPY